MKFICETGIFAILFTCGCIENCTTTVGKELPTKKSSENSNLHHCTIDDTIVSDEEFQHYLKILKKYHILGSAPKQLPGAGLDMTLLTGWASSMNTELFRKVGTIIISRRERTLIDVFHLIGGHTGTAFQKQILELSCNRYSTYCPANRQQCSRTSHN